MNLFSELYGAYYNTVAKLIAAAIRSPLTDEMIRKIIAEEAFSESEATIFSAIKEQRWQIIDPDGGTAIQNTPTMPLTTLEKRWLKAISLDPRLRLFGDIFPELSDVEPLFTPDDYRIVDRYADGDSYQSEEYATNFRVILSALKLGAPLRITYQREGRPEVEHILVPTSLEYSEKDDKFRLIGDFRGKAMTLNLGKITECRIYDGELPPQTPSEEPLSQCVVLEILNEHNALERVLLHFAHFRKQAEQLDNNRYKLTLWYDRGDETEMVIRVLSFGSRVKVIQPDEFVGLIKERIQKQLTYHI
ncbi:MAG: WYL domain-containing protein [Clostridia bacterium]|nr:WYL domain-containing protein [Clostridia bacterium]